VLSLPPAFNLSHDQTLQFKKFNRSICTDYKKSLNMNFKLSTYQDFKIKNMFKQSQSTSAHTDCLISC
ncbi:hypothetical protein Q7282_04455, partial [Glaesserella parasuis]|nr:hypothetical protein [Glaesserella parasuis]MDO9847893.1 hypothetical protein [Glaesserella parasuis]MDO9936587.1 hypothetical protein [Glaesserella parasuis]MDP0009171.1 hypothetical protein [Glaesserella parasuis]MDP0010145.1 hypothetical protein [Glaesserella parasuis]